VRNKVDRIILEGSIKALKNEINQILFNIKGNCWSGIVSNSKFCSLGAAIDQCKEKLEYMEELLDKLKELEPGNK